MALLNINWHGMEFERGLQILRVSLDAASSALEANRIETQQKWDDYEQAIENGAMPDIIWEDDIKVWDRSMAFEDELRMIHETSGIMRKAHVIAVYHLWERIVGAWTRASGQPDHKKLVGLLTGKRINVHPRMAAIRDLNNALKHNSGKYGRALLQSWPELFTDRFRETIEARLEKIKADPSSSGVDWHEAITITPGRVNEIMEAVRQSGPVWGREE
ncbi:hypothetical protein ACIQTU_10195 [Brevundimonas sp. NPDC090276]|uniref:hypothetical protein n=1 Tax=Brevundimonas sp. NPDC090276 TaxID=3363956 RepID=UPI00383B68AC